MNVLRCKVNTSFMSYQNKYANGKIYKIICIEDPDQFYIGSTCLTIQQRWQSHKNSSRNPKKNKTKLYRTINDKGLDKYVIELVEDYPCESHLELRKREDHFILQLKPTLNTSRAWISVEESKENMDHYQQVYRVEKTEIIRERQAIYRANNKATIHRKKACPLCGRVVTQKLMKRHQRSKICKIEAYVEIEFISSHAGGPRGV